MYESQFGLDGFTRGHDHLPLGSMVGTIDGARYAGDMSDDHGVKTSRELLEWQLQNLKVRLQHPCAERVFQILQENGCDPDNLPHGHELVTSLNRVSRTLYLLFVAVEKDFDSVCESMREQGQRQIIKKQSTPPLVAVFTPGGEMPVPVAA